MAKKKTSKPSIYLDVEREIDTYFYNYEGIGSNGVRLGKIKHIVKNIFDFPFPLTEKESWLTWLIEGYGISLRTAREYLKDAEILAYKLIDEIGERWDRFNGGDKKR